MRLAHSTLLAPPPAGSYSQAISVQGTLVFISGQTPREASGLRFKGAPFAEQVVRTLDNLEAVAKAAGCSLADAVKVTVYLRDLALKDEFDVIYRRYLSAPFPARTLVPAAFVDFDIEIDAVLQSPQSQENKFR